MLEDQQSRRFEEFFDRIKDIFKKGVEERGIKEELIITPSSEFKGYAIDLPKKQKDMYHGSSYEILCNIPKTWCKIKGDLVVEEDYDYEPTKILEESDCKVFGVHTHAAKREEQKLPYRESHIPMKMVNFLKNY